MDPIVELTKQFSQLTLVIQASMQSHPSIGMPNSTSAAASVPTLRPDRPLCIWCDSKIHHRREYTEFMEALRTEQVSLNERR
jgi:hypothetical protein